MAAGASPLRDDWLDAPSTRRLGGDHPARAEILERHATACNRGLPSYVDPVSGLAVFTAHLLASRGDCCDSGCRHCPFVDA